VSLDKQGKKNFRKLALGWLQDRDAERILREIVVAPKPAQHKKKETESSTYTLFYYFIRTIGAASLVFGAAGLMTEISFTICAVCVYLGLIVLCVDPWIEPALRKVSPWLRAIPSIIFIIPLFAVTRYVIFLPAALEIKGTDYNGDFPSGRTIAGIEWKPAYSELEIVFSNHADHDYKDLDVVVGVNEYIAAIGKTEFPGVTVFNTQVGPDALRGTNNDKSGRVSYEQDRNMKLLSGGVRVLCDKLPKDTSFSVILALVIVPSAGEHSRPSASNSLLALQSSDLPNRDDLYGPRTAATQFGVSGWYKSLGQRPHRVRKIYEVTQR
jgi:hypothetical protein